MLLFLIMLQSFLNNFYETFNNQEEMTDILTNINEYYSVVVE